MKFGKKQLVLASLVLRFISTGSSPEQTDCLWETVPLRPASWVRRSW